MVIILNSQKTNMGKNVKNINGENYKMVKF